MCPDSLREGLKNAKRPPKYLYINPTGANPTGTILSEKRRSEIYKLVCQHDLILLEDDPYYYVQVYERSSLNVPLEGVKDFVTIKFKLSITKIVTRG